MNSATNKDKREKWLALVEEQEKSGLTQEAFCVLHNLAVSNLVYYRKIFRGKQLPKDPSGTFSAVNITKPSSGEIRLILPNGFQCVFPPDLESTRVKELIGTLLSC
jgi:hypothetical protein